MQSIGFDIAHLLAGSLLVLSFVLLLVLSFAIMQTIAAQIIRQPIDLGLLPERIGRISGRECLSRCGV